MKDIWKKKKHYKKNNSFILKKQKGKILLYVISFPVCIASGLIVSLIFSLPILIGVSIGFTAYIMFCLVYFSSNKTLETGREYGEARWAGPEEVLPSIASDEASDKILSQGLHMALDDRKTGLNASCLLIGGSGSGKSFRYVVPNLLQANSSFVITDPKGTLLTDYGNYLEHHGYRVSVINTVNPWQSDSFNPFFYIRSNSDIVRLVNDYIRATTPKNSNEGEVFWKLAEAKLCTALIQLMFVAFPEDKTMSRFLKLLNMCEPPESDEKEKKDSELTRLFRDYKDSEVPLPVSGITGHAETISGQRAFENYMGIMNSAPDTCRSVIISAQSRYDSISNSPALIGLLSGKASVDFRAIGNGYNGTLQKTALFIVSSDIDRTYAGLTLWILSSLFNELYASADAHSDGRLPIPVQIFLDEFANTPQSDNVLQLWATARSRGISMTAVVQSQGQLKGLFKDESENIQGTSDCLIYLGSNEPSVHKAISEQLGKYTLTKQSSSTPTGFSGNGSHSTDSIGKDLMSIDRVRMLPNDKEIILIRGFDPVTDYKFRTQESPKFREAMALGKYIYSEHHSAEILIDRSGPLNEPELESLTNTGSETLYFSLDEWNHISGPDIDCDYTADEDLDWENIVCSLHFGNSYDEAYPGLSSFPEAIQEHILSDDFTSEQLKEASLGLADGLSEKEILWYFEASNTPELMEAMRIILQR